MRLDLVQFLCSVKHRHPCPFSLATINRARVSRYVRERDVGPPELASSWKLTQGGEDAYGAWLRAHYAPGGHPDLPAGAGC